MLASPERNLFLSVFQKTILVRCNDAVSRELLESGYGALTVPSVTAIDFSYTIGQLEADAGFFLTRDGQDQIVARHVAEFLFFFEKDITLELQRRRSDLYFLHAAAVEHKNKAVIIVAASGTGKSTTTWGLLHMGFHYLSDELAPIGLDTMTVQAFPHALNLKSEPPGPYPLPLKTLRTSETLHVPVELLPGQASLMPIPVAAVFFLKRESVSLRPQRRALSVGEASIRLLANALNPLAHHADGLDAAIAIARQARCFELQVAGLVETCEMLRAALEE